MQTIREYIKEIGDKKFKKQLTDLGKQQIKYPNWIITDCRFENELKAVKERDGITIRVQRPEYCPNCPMEDLTSQDCGDCAVYQHEIYPSLHESEIALDNAEFDYTIDNNSDINSLIEKIKEILIKEKIL